MNQGFVYYFKILRARKNLSARKLSLECGLSSSYVSKLEGDGVVPNAAVFMKLMEKLEASDREILILLRLLVYENEVDMNEI